MPWFASWPESIKKRACRYLLQHYVGQFLQEKLRLDQLSVDLYNGTGHVNDVALDIWALNAMLDQAHVPMELIDGFIGSIEVSIPWTALLNDCCKVEIKGLEITLQPKYRTDEDHGSMSDSFYRSIGSMTTSMQLAQECLKEEESETKDTSAGGLFEGLEVFAQTIESVLSRVKVSLTDMVIRIEHLPDNAKNGIALEIHIDRIDYFDEITMDDGNDNSSPNNKSGSTSDKNTVFQRDSVTCKHFRATGLRILLDEFPEHLRTTPPGSTGSPQATSPINISGSPDFETMTHAGQELPKTTEERANNGPLLIGKFFEKQELKLRIRQSEHVSVPKIDAECYLGTCGLFLTPSQVHLLTEFVSGLISPATVNHCKDGMVSLQTNNFATCTDGIRLSPNEGGQRTDAGEKMKNNNFKINEDLYMAQPSYPDMEDGDQFFSLDASKQFSRPEPSEYGENSEFSSSIYSQSTAFTPSLAYTQRSNFPKFSHMHPTSKLMGAGHHQYINEQSDTKYHTYGSSLASDGRRQLPSRSEEDKNSNHCHYQFQIRAIALTILHINPLPPSASPTHSHKSAESSLTVTPHPSLGSNVDSHSCDGAKISNCHAEMSEKYFSSCETILDETLKFDKSISSARKELAAVCSPHDHLRFVAAHVCLNSEQKPSQNLNTELSFGRAELTECVFSDPPQRPKNSQKGYKVTNSPKIHIKKCPIHSELLVFNSKPSLLNVNTPNASPDIRIHLSSHSGHRDIKTSLHVHLSACESEVDISIVDRLNTLLHPPDTELKMSSTTASLFSPHSYSHSHPDAFNRQAAFNEVLADDIKEQTINCDISASHLKINFRFPIADLRPEMERRPWYARSLRDEILILEANEIAFHTSSLGSNNHSSAPSGRIGNSGNQQSQEYEITVKELHILYSDEPDKNPKSFLRICQSPADMEPLGGPVDANSDFDCPHIKITINPNQGKTSDLLLQANDDMSEQTFAKSKTHAGNNADLWFDEDFLMSGSFDGTDENTNPSPFSSRKVIYNAEELILPGDPNEIAAFSDHAISTSLISISIHLPAVNAFLISKSFFENLYNRINNDILLWAPAAPKPHNKSKSWLDSRSVSYFSENNCHIPGKGLDIASQVLGHTFDEDDGSVSSDSDDASTHYSRPSLLGTSRQFVKSYDNSKEVKQQSLISITTKIGYGKISAKCNSLLPDGSVSRSEHGEVVVMLENANIFNVAGYCGNPLLDYVCVQIADVSLYHKAAIPTLNSTLFHVERLTAERPEHLDKIITKCEDGISRTFKQGNETQSMLVLAIKIQTEEARAMKQCLIAAGVSDVTLHHRFAHPGQSWLEQIIDFVDATDDKVLGYKPPSFITQIHLNVKNSAAVYKPMHMSPCISAVVAATSFSLSSNLVAGAAMSILNIIIDEAKLYITDKQEIPYIDISLDYACVLNINLLELCLKLSNQTPSQSCSQSMIENYPLIDFQASNNMIMLHTCADSCAALGALVRYLADDGDFSAEMVDDDSISDYQSQVNGGFVEQDDVPEEFDSAADSSDQEGNLADLMADAMEEVFEDARSDLESFNKPKKFTSPMTESMYAFSTSSKDKKPKHHVPKSKDIMSQSVMIPSDSSRKSKPRKDSRYRPLRSHNVRRYSEAPDDDDFCIIDDELGVSNHSSEPEINYCIHEEDGVPDQIIVEDNYFKRTAGKIDELQAPENFPTPVMRYTLKELSCVWYMYGGYDFKSTDPPSRKNSGAKDVPHQNYNRSSPIQLKYNARQRKVDIGKQGSSRDSTMLMEVHLTKVRCRFEQYPDDKLEAARIIVIVSDFEIRDKLQASKINKFLYRFHSESSPRRAHAKALSVKVLQIRPEGVGTPTESKLRISLQPLRLNVDQDTLNFLTKFFTDLSTSANDENGSPSHWIAPMSEYKTAVGSPSSAQNAHTSPKTHGTPYSSPIMTRPKTRNLETSQTSENSELPMGTSPSANSGVSSNRSTVSAPTLQPTFFREVIFSPEVPIRLDYHGKRIDTEQGTISGLLMGLGQLNCSQLKLKRIVHRHGLLGVDKLITFLLNEWAADIRANQLPLILGGVGPMHSVVQLFKGVRDLVYLPVEQYRKDGRLVRGLQRGATSFGTSTAIAALEITNRAIGLVQTAAETTYELVSPQELHRREAHAQRNWRTLGNHAIRGQPADIREGMSNALTVVKHGVEDTAGAIVRVAQKEHERKGVTGAVGGVLRHIPPALVRPVIMATEATTNVLSGIRNQIQPDAKQQDEDKWKNMNVEES